MIINTEQFEGDKKKLAIARLQAMSDTINLVIDNHSLSKNEAIDNIKKDSKLGKKLVDIQIDFLRDMASGKLYNYS